MNLDICDRRCRIAVMHTVHQTNYRFALLLLFFVITGCDNYTITKDSAGRTVRLNKSNGELVVVDGDRIVVPKSPEAAEEELRKKSEVEKQTREKLAQKREWDEQDVLGSKAKLTSIYIGEEMKFNLYFAPLVKGWENSSYVANPMTLIFTKNGIKVFEKKLPRASFTRMVDDNKTVGLRVDGSLAMSPDEYELLGGWSLTWSF
jgi:hypothetical protein